MSLSELERRFFDRSGPTDVVGLMRPLAVIVTWSRFGAAFVPAFLDEPAWWGVAGLFWVASALAFVGLFSRVAIGLTGACCLALYWGHGVFGGVAPLASHHVFAQALLCAWLALTPCGGSFSLDRLWRGVPDSGPRWGQDLIRLQLTVLYLGAVFEKSYPAWFDGSRMEQILLYVYVGSDAVDGPWLARFAWVSAIGTWGVELGLAVAIWVRRWRFAVLAVGWGFHAGVYALVPVGTFSATMAVFLLVALDPGDVRRWVGQAAPIARGPRLAWALAPILLWPLLRAADADVPGPALRAFEDLALDACDVRFHAVGMELPGPPGARSGGIDGVRRAASAMCRQIGAPVDARGVCATRSGWEPVSIEQVCDPPGPDPTQGRRRSAW